MAQHIGGVADRAARSYVSGDTSLGDRVTAEATRGAIGGLAKGAAVGLLTGAGLATGVISPSTGASVMAPLAAGARCSPSFLYLNRGHTRRPSRRQ